MELTQSIVRNDNDCNNEILDVDEIKTFLDCRYLSACEACWRINQFHVQYRSIGVERLSFHLPDEQVVTFKDSDNLNTAIDRIDVEKTILHNGWPQIASTRMQGN